MKKEEQYEVLIIGGGPAGCAAAIILAGRGIDDVLLIEAGHGDETRIGESIPPDTRVLFERLGILKDFLEERHDTCFGSCSVWGSDKPGYNDFLYNPHGLGWHLDRRRFDVFLLGEAQNRGAEVLTGTRFQGIERELVDGFSIGIKGNEGKSRIVRGGFVVDASGHRAVFAKSMGCESEVSDRLICVYGFFDLDQESKLSRLTMLEAVRDGWWYAARLPEGKAVAMFAADPETVKRKNLREDAEWLWRLSNTMHIAPALSKCRFITNSLLTLPAHSLIRRPLAGDRWLAAGDAASVYDPISAQGVYKALLDGAAAGDAVADRLEGAKEAFSSHASGVENRFAQYQANRDYLYGLEKRWPGAPFWEHRLAANKGTAKRFSSTQVNVPITVRGRAH